MKKTCHVVSVLLCFVLLCSSPFSEAFIVANIAFQFTEDPFLQNKETKKSFIFYSKMFVLSEKDTTVPGIVIFLILTCSFKSLGTSSEFATMLVLLVKNSLP